MYLKPFTASPYYDFFDAFLLGFKPETFVAGSTNCIMSIVYTVDDFFYFQNNISDFSYKAWEAPIMNLTKAIGGNFSGGIVKCELFVENAINELVRRYSTFNNNTADFLLSFLFNLMGKSLTFKSIFDQVDDDLKNQYYVDIANQYGRMVRVILDFEPELLQASLLEE